MRPGIEYGDQNLMRQDQSKGKMALPISRTYLFPVSRVRASGRIDSPEFFTL